MTTYHLSPLTTTVITIISFHPLSKIYSPMTSPTRSHSHNIFYFSPYLISSRLSNIDMSTFYIIIWTIRAQKETNVLIRAFGNIILSSRPLFVTDRVDPKKVYFTIIPDILSLSLSQCT